jgi:hypothetical protein
LKSLTGKDHFQDLGSDGNNTRTDLRETARECADWILLDQNRDQWQDLVNTVKVMVKVKKKSPLCLVSTAL